MEMPKICNAADFAKIAVISFTFIWTANKLLAKMGQNLLTTKTVN